MHRREFLLRGAAASAMLSMGGLMGRSALAAGQSKVGGMRLGLVTYNLAKDWTLDEIIERCQRTGFEGVELRTTHKHGVEPTLSAEERAAVRRKFEGSKVTLWGLGTTCEYHSPDQAEVRRQVDLTKQFVDLAADVGAIGVKVRPNGLPKEVPVEQTLKQIGNALKECGDYAAAKKQEIWLEVHGGGTSLLPNMRTIMETANHPWVFVCWNSNGSDVKDGSVKESLELVKQWVREVHLRELYADYPWAELFGLLQANAFDGFTNAEISESTDPETVMRYFRALWLALKGQTGPAGAFHP